MERVFAPWRMEWVRTDEASEPDRCVFCDLPEAGNDRENRIVARAPNGYLLLNKSPYTPGHLLVLPYRHVSTIDSMDEEGLFDVVVLVKRATAVVDDVLNPDGFNIGMNLGKAGGASIENHLHVHVVPRWDGDTTFMPTTANTKIIPEALDETYERLHREFADLDGASCSDPDCAVEL